MYYDPNRAKKKYEIKMRYKTIYFKLQIFCFFMIVLSIVSCNRPQSFSLKNETDKILKLHHAQRDYHFNKDSIAFADQFSNNFISVNKGDISKPSKEATLSRYNRYFSSVEFVTWDDGSDPIIKFSDDGSLAYTIVDKIVTVTFKNENDSLVEEETHFAWTTIYKKYGGKWKIDLVTSTNKPSTKKILKN